MKSSEIKPLRELLIKENQGLCKLCEHPLERPVLDHSHFSGFVRNVICSNCNVLLGKYENGLIRMARTTRAETITKNLWTYITTERSEMHPTHGRVKRKSHNKVGSKK